ncbi:MAG: toll/interleukin-1 receptor domain-containing protein [Saprospiraceae bacterium]|nr:toll/interleukin-1 receptor domain-containing protein [Saprospiraceae bacterium]
MNSNTLFISYNPYQPEEQTLAIRLHTIGAANGFRVFLPDRFNSDSILDRSTQARIDQSNYFILFSLTPTLSPIVQDEINYAWKKFKDKSKIILIYRTDGNKSLHPDASKHCTEIYFDPFREQMDTVNRRIINAISHKETQLKKNKESENGLLALLGIGLGLLVLNEVTKE